MYKNILYSPLASLVFLVLSSAFFMTFITIQLNSTHTPESVIGYIHSAFYGGMLIGAIKSEELINRIGHIRAYSVFSSLTTISIILQGLFEHPVAWVMFRFIAGFALAASYVIIESWLLAQSTKQNKGRILAIYMFCLYASQAGSQFLLDIVDVQTIQPFLLAAILSIMSIIPSSVTYMQAPEIETEQYKMSIAKYFSSAPLGFIGCSAAGLILSAIYGFLPSYAQDKNLSVSITVGLTIAGGFVLQWPIGKLSDMLDRSKVISAISFITIILCLLLMIIPTSTIITYVFCFCIGGLCFTIYPVCIAYVCDYFEQANIINITGVLLFSYGIGSVLGSTLVALLIEHYSASVIFAYIAFVALCLGAMSIYTVFKVESVAKEEQVSFVALPRATPIANNLDPRIDENQ